MFFVIFFMFIFLESKSLEINKDYSPPNVTLTNLNMTTFEILDISSLPKYCLPPPDVKVDEIKKHFISRRNIKEDFQDKENVTELENNITSTYKTDDHVDLSNLTEEFLRCKLWGIKYGCYQILPNGSAYLPLYGHQFDNANYFIANEKLLICPSKMMNPVSPDALSIISIVGLSISAICIFVHMVIFISTSTLRNLPGYCLFSLCVALIIGYSCFFVIPTLESFEDCSYIGMMMFYFFLASFFWMNILSYDVWRSLRKATIQLRLSTQIWSRFSIYSAYSWGAPGLIVLSAVIIDKLGDVSIHYKLIFKRTTCWFMHKEALLAYFAIPFFILQCINLIFFIWSFIMITGTSMKSSENRTALWASFCIIMRLAVIMGLTWFFGVLAVATNTKVLWYFYVIFNTLQGVFIFFSFSFSQILLLRPLNAWKSRILKRDVSSRRSQYSVRSQQVTISM